MKKKIVVVLLSATLALSMSACGGSGNSDSTANAGSSAKTEEAVEEVTYQSILDDYSKQIEDAAPGLVDEYNSEAANAAGDVTKLAEISNAKIEKLATICNDGVSEMASLKLKNGDDDATYEEWAAKLQTVYTDNSQKITDAYMSSATQ